MISYKFKHAFAKRTSKQEKIDEKKNFLKQRKDK